MYATSFSRLIVPLAALLLLSAHAVEVPPQTNAEALSGPAFESCEDAFEVKNLAGGQAPAGIFLTLIGEMRNQETPRPFTSLLITDEKGCATPKGKEIERVVWAKWGIAFSPDQQWFPTPTVFLAPTGDPYDAFYYKIGTPVSAVRRSDLTDDGEALKRYRAHIRAQVIRLFSVYGSENISEIEQTGVLNEENIRYVVQEASGTAPFPCDPVFCLELKGGASPHWTVKGANARELAGFLGPTLLGLPIEGPTREIAVQIKAVDIRDRPVQGITVGLYTDKATMLPKTTDQQGAVTFKLDGHPTAVILLDGHERYAPVIYDVKHSANEYTVKLQEHPDTASPAEAETLLNQALDASFTGIDIATMAGKLPSGASIQCVPSVFCVSPAVTEGQVQFRVEGQLVDYLVKLLPGRDFLYRGFKVGM